ncbi:MAG TPA: TonB-dependent receptor, partial [Prolixibacteraceae bacterium]|nr:TonB-dependent receptor [Prolixibacteraceae bacterium]
MKTIYFLLLLLFLLSATRESSAFNIVSAKIVLTGKVTDQETGEPIPGATIYIPDLKTGAVSDGNGLYKINNLPQGKLLIQVMFIGYKTAVERVDLATTQTMDFVLVQTAAEVNEVVVTGTSMANEIKHNPVPMVTVDRIGIQQNLSTNVIDAIAKLPGISAVTTGPNVSKPFIHGLGFNRVLTLYDGVRQEGQQWGDEHGIEVDENSVDRIEVVKGPASLTYGSDALAGVVNLIPAPPVPNGTIKGRVLADYQSNNGLSLGSVSLAGNDNGFVWSGTASHKQTTNYQNKYDGRVYGTAFKETDLNGNIGLTKHWGYANLNFSLFDDLQEIPDGSRDSLTRKFTKQITEADTFRPIVTGSELNSYKIATLHQHVQHYKVYSSNSFIIGDSKIGLILGDQQNVRREFSHPEHPDLAGLYLVLNTFTYDLKYYLPEFNNWETTIGINGMAQNNTNKGTEFIIPDYRQFDIGPFALVQRSLNKLALSAGVRYDLRRFNNDAMFVLPDPQNGFDRQVSSPVGADHRFFKFNHTFSGFSGSIGATYKLSNCFLIKGNLARGFRAPNIAEISANGVHPGTLIYQIGNTGFKPEFSLQGDLGVSYSSTHVTGNAEIFTNTISNYIFNQKLLNDRGGDSIIVTGNQTFKYQQAKAQLYGGEVS